MHLPASRPDDLKGAQPVMNSRRIIPNIDFLPSAESVDCDGALLMCGVDNHISHRRRVLQEYF